jgi:hypothetical protein
MFRVPGFSGCCHGTFICHLLKTTLYYTSKHPTNFKCAMCEGMCQHVSMSFTKTCECARECISAFSLVYVPLTCLQYTHNMLICLHTYDTLIHAYSTTHIDSPITCSYVYTYMIHTCTHKYVWASECMWVGEECMYGEVRACMSEWITWKDVWMGCEHVHIVRARVYGICIQWGMCIYIAKVCMHTVV